jgi:arylsulfatase
MIATWYVEAGKYDVLPIDSRGTQRFADERPAIAVDRTRYVYFPGTESVPSSAGPRVLNRPHSIEADVEIPKGGAEGVLLSSGGIDGGFVFYVKDRKLYYAHNYCMLDVYRVESSVDVPEGRHKLRYEFEPTGKPDVAHGKGTPGRAQLYIDGKLAGQAEFPVTIPLILGLSGGYQVGRNAGSPVTSDYQPPFAFTGTIYDVTVDVSGELIQDKDAEARMLLARQ